MTDGDVETGVDAGELSCRDTPARLGESTEEWRVDVTTVEVNGSITHNGDPLAAKPFGPRAQSGISERGYLQFLPASTPLDYEPAAEPTNVVALGDDGPAEFTARLIEGTYDVYYMTQPGAKVWSPGPRLRVRDDWTTRSEESLDIDLRSVDVSGTWTVDGQEPSSVENAQFAPRGRIVFERLGPRGDVIDMYHAELPDSGPADFGARLPLGDYRVRLVDTHGLDGLLGDRVVREQVSVVEAGGEQTIDIDTKTHEVEGTVDVNGALMPDNQESSRSRAKLIFTRDASVGTGRTIVRLDGSGAANFETRLYEGSYNVELETGLAKHQDALPPNRTILLREGWSIGSNTDLSLNLPLAEVSGSVTVNGQEMAPTATGQKRGTVYFVPSRVEETRVDSSRLELLVSKAVAEATVGGERAAEFQLELDRAETYDIFFETAELPSGSTLPSQQITKLRDDWSPGGGPLALNVETFEVSGRVTVDGAPDGGRIDGPGGVIFRGRDADSMWWYKVIFDWNVGQSVTFDATLLDGAYDVLVRTPYQREGGTVFQTLLVREDWRVREGPLELELPRQAEVAGMVYLDGKPLSEGTAGELAGELQFQLPRQKSWEGAARSVSGGAFAPIPLYNRPYQIYLKTESSLGTAQPDGVRGPVGAVCRP